MTPETNGQIDVDAMIAQDLARIDARRKEQLENPPVLPREFPRGSERAAGEICVRLIASAKIVRRATVKEARLTADANQGTSVIAVLDSGEPVYVQ